MEQSPLCRRVTYSFNLSESRRSAQGPLLGSDGLKRGQQDFRFLRGDRPALRSRALFFGLSLSPDLGFNPDVFRAMGAPTTPHPAAHETSTVTIRVHRRSRRRVGASCNILQAFLASRASHAFICRVTCFRDVPPVCAFRSTAPSRVRNDSASLEKCGDAVLRSANERLCHSFRCSSNAGPIDRRCHGLPERGHLS